jgi:hypothetical protein
VSEITCCVFSFTRVINVFTYDDFCKEPKSTFNRCNPLRLKFQIKFAEYNFEPV